MPKLGRKNSSISLDNKHPSPPHPQGRLPMTYVMTLPISLMIKSPRLSSPWTTTIGHPTKTRPPCKDVNNPPRHPLTTGNLSLPSPKQRSLKWLPIYSKPSTHISDPIPAQLAKKLKLTLGPLWTKIINSSLRTGVMPDCLKIGQVTPLLKKKTALTQTISITSGLSPISHFYPKSWKDVFSCNLPNTLTVTTLLDPHQSGFRKGCSTETAILNVIDDVYKSLDMDWCGLLILLDQSAAFDTVDHKLLINALWERVGAEEVVL